MWKCITIAQALRRLTQQTGSLPTWHVCGGAQDGEKRKKIELNGEEIEENRTCLDHG